MIRGMVASPCGKSAFPRRLATVVLVGLASAVASLGGCLPDRENSLLRTARMREIDQERLAAERAQRELQILRQLGDDARSSIADAKARSVAASAELRAVLAQLERELGVLRAGEQDLAAAKQRAAEIEQQLVPLRQMEGQLAGVAEKQQALAAQLAAAEADLQGREKALAERQAQLAPQIAGVQAQLDALAKVDEALKAAQAAAAALAPPPPAAAPAPTPPAAAEPAKK
ncbi:MAG: hypothetical protein RL398_3659 [Planctomycetota bacterium]